MKKIVCCNKNLSRQDLANPFRNMPYHEQIVKAGVMNIKDKSIIEDLGNGYVTTKVIDNEVSK